MIDLTTHIEKLRSGGIILYPTDTIWGIGCDATDEKACERIANLKGRLDDKSFVLLADGFPMIQKYILEFPEVCYDLADLATKPLTIIYPNAKGLAPSVLANDGSIGIRITDDPICLKLIRGMRKPLVSTSANLTGEDSPVEFRDIDSKITEGVDVIVKDRLKEKRMKASQIIKIGLGGQVTVIRK
ncbi:MAG: threonylcarbamoyl-AMP synthase [Crocinitomicaceae bacterium]|nr:L-threonylcarbamoyladenylate synthase [Flavobacteriales bacterium]NQZ35403.1 threonylcarbamoyl-AMP synthase [Crocinitomicaceae bacterium]